MKNTRIFSIMFSAPAFILYTLFITVSVVYSIYYSATSWDAVQQPVFIGIKNYADLILDSDYWLVVRNTFTLVFYSLLFQVPVGLILAYLIFRVKIGSKFFRTVYFFPVVIAPVAIGIMFQLFYNGDFGPLNKLLGAVGMGFLKKNWLSDSDVVLNSVVFPQVWQYIGTFVVIFLASMKSIPEEMFESASIDGANSFKVFYKIVIPLVAEAMQISIILCVTGSLKGFDTPWSITKGGPGLASSYIAILMYKKAFINFNFGYASAITTTILIYSLTFTVIFKKIFSKSSVEF